MIEKEFVVDERLFTLERNKYLLVNVSAYRARQINDGVEVYVKTPNRHPLHIALREIMEGHIGYTVGESDLEEEVKTEEDTFRFDEMLDLEGDFDLDDEEAFEIDELDYEAEFAGSDKE